MGNQKSEIILLGGFGRSGTTALRELLRFHKDIYSFPYEFRLLTDPDGLLSLHAALVTNWTPWQADFAIDRFLKMTRNLGSRYFGNYVGSGYRNHLKNSYKYAVHELEKELVSFSYKGVWAGRANLLNKGLLRITKHNRFFFNTSDIHFTRPFKAEEFYLLSQKFLTNLFAAKLIEENKKTILIHEPNVTLNPEKCLRLTGSEKIIVIYRDPRDVFGSFQGRDWSPQKLEQAIEYQKQTQMRWIQMKQELDSSQFLEIRFENFINDFESQLNKIGSFIGVTLSQDLLNKSGFKPGKFNIGRWKKQFPEAKHDLINESFKEILEKYNYPI